jgi:hypothetical protein
VIFSISSSLSHHSSILLNSTIEKALTNFLTYAVSNSGISIIALYFLTGISIIDIFVKLSLHVLNLFISHKNVVAGSATTPVIVDQVAV